MAKLSQLLLHDPDPNGLETLTYVFQKNGCVVTATSDGSKLVDLVQMLSPGAPLVLVALRDPEQVGLDLIREITGNPRTRNLACVAIGPARLRGAALQVGAFGLLSSPVFVRDVLDASKLVAAATLPGSRPSPDTEISLKLSEIGGIYFLIRALAATGRSSAVEVQRGQRRGELRFIEGDLSSAQIGALSGLSALHQALLWDEAELRLKFRNVVRRGGQLSLKNEELIEECDRFLRDFAHEVKDLGVARTIYRPGRISVQPTAALPSEVVPLLRLFDGTRELGQIIDESPFRVFDTLRIVRQFVTAEAIRPDSVPAVSFDGTVAMAPAALADWFQQTTQASSIDLAGSSGEASRARPSPTAGTSRPSSPFISVVTGSDRTPVTGGDSRPPTQLPAEENQAKRTLTRRDYPIKPAPATIAVVPGGSRDVTVGGPRAVGSPLSGVARGEIQTTAAPLRKIERGTKPNNPSVLVELGPPPAKRSPPALAGAKPAPARAGALPSVVVEPMTPPPVVIAPPPPLVSAPPPVIILPPRPAVIAPPLAVVITPPLPVVITPPPLAITPPPFVAAPVAAPPQPEAPTPRPEGTTTPPPVIAPPVTAPPVTAPLTAARPMPAVGAPAAVPPPVTSLAAPILGEPAHHARTPSGSFNAVEADFFDREADLYKRESAETFDDLDGVGGSRRPGSSRKP
jgi:CheY-like chemotaxis protein